MEMLRIKSTIQAENFKMRKIYTLQRLLQAKGLKIEVIADVLWIVREGYKCGTYYPNDFEIDIKNEFKRLFKLAQNV